MQYRQISYNASISSSAADKSEANYLQKLKDSFHNYFDCKQNYYSLLKKSSEKNNYLDLSFGFKLDRPLYGVCSSNTFSNRNFIIFIIGLENNKLSFLTKLKYADYDKYNLIAKSFLKYELDENASIHLDFTYDKKNNFTKYNIGSLIAYPESNNTVVRASFNEKNEISSKITMRFNDKIDFSLNSCFSIASGFRRESQQQANPLNPELYLDAKFGFGIQYSVEPKIGSNRNSSSFNSFVNDNEKGGFGDFVYESINSASNFFAKLIKSVDIY